MKTILKKYSESDQEFSNENNINIALPSTEGGIFENFFSFDNSSDVVPVNEVEAYFKHPITQDVDAISWWCDNATSYPNLFKLFKELSCVPATSASSERDFSVAGSILTDMRSVLLPENVNNLIIARNFL